ncbi:MAG: hypothetical protein GEU93_12885 [Propionibacteriales bacterium]|nr:hypothetical protein [Propionibacteriales bacterium]
MNAVPISVALVAGTLAAFNPCGFAVLSAFLAYNLGDAAAPTGVPSRVTRGLATGLLVALGFVGVFTMVGLPLSYGASVISDAIPWVGLAFGAILFVVGLATLAGRRISLPRAAIAPFHVRGRALTHVLFGVGYGVAPMACTLPVFLALVGVAASRDFATTLVVFTAYGAGLATVLMVLAVCAAIASEGIRRWAARALPYVGRITGALLVIAGGYLAYYSLRAELASPAAAASDPLVGVVTDFAAWIELSARSGGGVPLFLTLAAILAIAVTVSLRHRARTLRLAAGALAIAGMAGLIGYGVGGAGSGPTSASSDGTAKSGLPGDDLSARPATAEERKLLRNAGPAATLSYLSGLGQLQRLFDEKAGTPRVIALLSPTCVTCLRGADWLQDELARHPDADVQVYAVWLPVLPSDERTEWDGRILNDTRVVHMWDEDRVTGRWFAEHGYGKLPVQWDALFLYGSNSVWSNNDVPQGLVGWGRPIIAHATELSGKLDAHLTR